MDIDGAGELVGIDVENVELIDPAKRPHTPSPDEIARQCAELQSTWTDARKRIDAGAIRSSRGSRPRSARQDWGGDERIDDQRNFSQNSDPLVGLC